MSRARDMANGVTTFAPLASPDFTGTVDLTGTTVSLDDDEISLDKLAHSGTAGGGTFNGTIGASATFPSTVGNSLVFIKTETAPGTTTWDIEDCFSSTYATHMIEINELTVSTDAGLYWRFINTSGSVISATSYDWDIIGTRAGNNAYALSGAGASSWTLAYSLDSGAGHPFCGIFYVSGVFHDSLSPTFYGNFSLTDSSYADIIGTAGGRFTVQDSTNYDGFQLHAASGNISAGRISVYGIRHS